MVNQYSAKSLMRTKLPVKKKTIAWRRLRKRMVINYAVNLITHQFSISGSSLILKQRNWNMAGTSLIVALFPLEWLQQRTGVKGKEQRRPHSHSPSHARRSLCLHSFSMQRRRKNLAICPSRMCCSHPSLSSWVEGQRWPVRFLISLGWWDLGSVLTLRRGYW